MLFEIKEESGKISSIEPVPFKDFSAYGKLEKDLENLIADNLLGVLFEEAKLLTLSQERARQSEADIYALNEAGDLVIFELKRASVSKDAVQQGLRYAQDAGVWSFSKLQKVFRTYSESNESLVEAHMKAFDLEHALDQASFNTKQHILIIGSASDESLRTSVDYWKKHGVSIDFLPYRVYENNGQKFFEFFAPPYDIHINPSESKGVLFDTNKSSDEESLWSMLENCRVEAYGKAKRFVKHVNVGDIVFFSHTGSGVLAAAKVTSAVKTLDDYTLYRDVEFLTPIPKRGEPLKALKFSKVSEVVGKKFYWARTIKVPYLSLEESKILLEELTKFKLRA